MPDVVFHNTGFQHLPNKMDNPFIFDCPAEYFQQDVMLNSVKAFPNVTFHHDVVVVPAHEPMKFEGGVMGRSVRSKPKTEPIELRFIDRLQNQPEHFLHDPILQGRDT